MIYKKYRNKVGMKYARRLPYYRMMEEKKGKKIALHLLYMDI